MKSLTLDDVAALREERVKQAIADASPLYRTIMEKAYASTASPRSAIKAQCLICVGYDRVAVTHCTGHSCPLWAYRPYQIKGAKELNISSTKCRGSNAR